MIAKRPKPPKDNEKRRKQVRFNEKYNCAYDKKNNSDQKIYASMARMSSIDEFPSRNFCDSSQSTNWIFDSGSTCHMTPQVSGFITGSLEGTDKYIGVVEGHHVTAKQKGQVRIKMCDNNGDTFIATLNNALLAPDLCDRLFSMIKLMNSEHTCLFLKEFCTVYFGEKQRNTVTLPNSAQRKHAFLGKSRKCQR